MRTIPTLQGLQTIVENYAQQTKDIKNLRERVRRLTTQRDQANARNQELRAHLARYQQQLAERREMS